MVKERAVVMFTRITVAVAVVVLVFAAMSGGSALAGKPAGKGGGKPSPPSTATLSVSPNPAPAGTTAVTVTGSGFKPGEQVWTGMVGFISHMMTANSSGSVSYVESHAFTPGDYPVVAYTLGGGSKWVLTASTTLTVLP